MKRFFLPLAIIIFASLSLPAAVTDEVQSLVESGDYETAFQQAETLRKKSPRDGAVNYWYGRAAQGLGLESEAIEAFYAAADRGYADAYAQLVDFNLNDYNLEQAQSLIEKWRAALKKSKKAESEELQQTEERLLLMTNQLNRVEDFPVIAKFSVSKEDFAESLKKLNGNGGPAGVSFIKEKIPFYINNMTREVYWTQPDENGVNRLFMAGVLDDGTRDEAIELTQYVGDGDIATPFMMDDGETLYFSAKRNDGLGGYDIYMTRRDGKGGFYEPSLIGMPYNSPANDLLYVVDEENKIGWWATDRYAHTDSVAILVFVPADQRINVPADAPEITERARISNIKSTWPDNFNVRAALSRMPAPGREDDNSATQTFALSMGDGRIFTVPGDFSNRKAAVSMSDVIRSRRILDDTIERLELMRRAYAEGNKSLKNDILELEAEVSRQRDYLKKITNSVIRLETTGFY